MTDTIIFSVLIVILIVSFHMNKKNQQINHNEDDIR